MSSRLDRVNQWAVGLLMALLLLNVWLAVLDRYLLNWQMAWVEELARYLMIWGILLAVPSCVALRQHVRLTMVVERLPAGVQRWLGVVVDLIAIAFFGYVAVLGTGFVSQGLSQATMVFGMPMAIPFAAVSVSFGLAAIQTLLAMIRDYADSAAPSPEVAATVSGTTSLDPPLATDMKSGGGAVMIIAFIFIVLMVIGTPVGIALGLAGLIGMLDTGGLSFAAMAPTKVFHGLNIFPFLAMPFFILAGEIMNQTGITSRLMLFAQSLVGHFRGGLAHSNMVASVFFSGITGAATADAAAFGRTLVPEMVKQGYTRPYACAVTAAGSIIGPTIPPSGLMVVYGSLMGVSIGGLFAAGILPGLMICLVCMVIIAAFAKRKNLPKTDERASLVDILVYFKGSILALLMPVIILGGIVSGIVTPTEAASIAVAYALFVGGVIYRNLTLRILFRLLIRTAQISAVIYLIIGAASIFGWWLSFNQIPQAIASFIGTVSANPSITLLIIIGFLLLVGMVMDINAMLIILAPLLIPLTQQMGMDPLHAGIIFILALNISLMTPPIGACLFVLSSVTGESLERISVDLMPFLIGQLVLLFFFAFFPGITLFIPRMLGY